MCDPYRAPSKEDLFIKPADFNKSLFSLCMSDEFDDNGDLDGIIEESRKNLGQNDSHMIDMSVAVTKHINGKNK